MKNSALFFSTIFCFFALSSIGAEKVTVSKKNGGPKGYRNITETHSGEVHKLKCSDPGSEKCVWGQGSNVASPGQMLAIDLHVSDQVSNQVDTGIGNLSGTNIWFYWIYSEATGELRYNVTLDNPDYEF